MRKALLIIDDDIDDCRILEESLYQIGPLDHIEYRHNIKSALEYLEENRDELPKVVVIDMNLPIIDGMKGLQMILPKYPMIVIMYTTTCTPEIKQKAIESGAFDCVQKGNTYADNLRFAKRVFDILQDPAAVNRPALS